MSILKLSTMLIAAVLVTVPVMGNAQIDLKVPGVSMKSGSNGMSFSFGSGNDVSNTAGQIENVEMEGFAIINGEVMIDGEKIPRGKTRHTGKKSGIKYKIVWGKDGNVAVHQE